MEKKSGSIFLIRFFYDSKHQIKQLSVMLINILHIYRMNWLKYFILLAIVFNLGSSQQVHAQKKFNDYSRIDSLQLDSLHDLEIRLEALGKRMVTSLDEEERLTSGYHFIKTFIRALRIENSYFYNFDTIKNISVLYAPDNYFRIITWNLALDNESYRNYGVIQLNPDAMKKLKDTTNLRAYYPLIDKSDRIKNVMDTTVSSECWFGALYYAIEVSTYKKKNYYTLIGWDGNTQMTNRKIVESLYFENNQPFFGAPIFDLKDNRYKKPLKRMVFEYNNRANMVLRFEKDKNILVQENVAPPKVQDYGKPETYVPDGSYDFYKFNKKTGVWEKQPGMLKEFDMQKD
jgi:hypothetical protein